MVLQLIFGLLIFVVAVYITMRVLGNLFYGLLLIGLVFLASFLIVGSFPNLKEIPIIGRWLPDSSNFPKTTGEFIKVIKNVFFDLEIIGHSRTSRGDLLVLVANAGRMQLTDFHVFVDGEAANIINNPKDPLKSGEATVIEVDWKAEFNAISVKTKESSAIYPI